VSTELPQIIFVMGKGGVGRSSVSGALALGFAERGERVLIMEWTVAEAFAPWFGLPPMETERSGDWKWIPRPREISPRVSVFNYRLQEALRGYFVDHLGLERFYAKVVDGPHLRRLVEAAPGIAELLFVGQLWWMVELAPAEAGFGFDRIIVDAPATGHGASLLDLPAALSTIGATGLLAMEVQRLVKMLADPKRVGAAVVSLAEELSVEETLELMPRLTKDLSRKPLAVFVNRSVTGLVGPEGGPVLADRPFTPAARAGLDTVTADLRSRVRLEAQLRTELAGLTSLGVFSLPEQLVVSGDTKPVEIVRGLARNLTAQLRRLP
jgi:anion-transporting  ArsA/GET3 family ATPase